jgi:hypothetical protein
VDELSFFTIMEMRTVPGVKFRVDKWNPHAGAKAEIATAWFKIFGMPVEKRFEKRAALVASLVGIPVEIDKTNLKRWEYVRAKNGCRDITKVPAKVEGLLDLHFYDFTFQSEVRTERNASTTWNTWTKNTDRSNDDNPSPKKAKKGDDNRFQKESTSLSQEEGDYSSQEQGRRHGKQPQEREPMNLVMEEDYQNNKQTEKGKEIQESENIERNEEGDQEMGEKGDKDFNEEDSEDSGPCFVDIISPGGTHLNFGDFQNMELKEIFKVKK